MSDPDPDELDPIPDWEDPCLRLQNRLEEMTGIREIRLPKEEDEEYDE